MTNAYNLEVFISKIESWGLMDVLLPFLFLFVVVFAILSKTKVLGENKRNFNMVIALAFALTVVTLHVTGKYPEGRDPVVMMNNSIMIVVPIVIAIVGFFLIIGAWGGQSPKTGILAAKVFGLSFIFFINFAFPNMHFGWSLVIALASFWAILYVHHTAPEDKHLILSSIAFISLAALIYSYGSQFGLFHGIPPWLRDPVLRSVIIFVAVFGVIASLIVRGEK